MGKRSVNSRFLSFSFLFTHFYSGNSFKKKQKKFEINAHLLVFDEPFLCPETLNLLLYQQVENEFQKLMQPMQLLQWQLQLQLQTRQGAGHVSTASLHDATAPSERYPHQRTRQHHFPCNPHLHPQTLRWVFPVGCCDILHLPCYPCSYGAILVDSYQLKLV